MRLELTIDQVNLLLSAATSVQQELEGVKQAIVAQGNAQVPQQPAPAQPAQEQSNANHTSPDRNGNPSENRTSAELAYCARLEGVAEAESRPHGPDGTSG